ncbi:MAG TPA: cupin domain-containing protein [Fimbriimonadaceae bacterium]|nr:cupin domain-containing protein [Fimbriimonadaceae bacterium]
MKTLEKPIIREVGVESAVWYFSNRLTYLVDPEEVDGKFGLFHARISKNGMPPAHVHTREDEAFFMLKGEFRILVGDREYFAKPGDLVYLPRGVAHAAIPMTEEVETLALILPGDMMSFFRGFSYPALHDGLPNPDERRIPDVADILRAAYEHQLTQLPPGASPSNWYMPEIHAEPMHVTAHSSEGFEVPGAEVRPILRLENTQKLMSMYEVEVSGNSSFNALGQDALTIVVLDGAFEIEVDGMQIIGTQNTAIQVPAGASRLVKNYTHANGRILLLAANPALELALESSGCMAISA